MSIRLKLIIIILSLVTIPLLVVGVVSFQNYQASLQAARMAQLQELARYKAERIESYFVTLRDGMAMAQSFYNIRKNLPELARSNGIPRDPESKAAKDMLDLQMVRIQKVLQLTDIMLTNNAGTIVYVSNPAHLTTDFERSLADLWPASTKPMNDTINFSEIFLNKLAGNRAEMLATSPVADLSGAAAGTVVFEIDMAPLYKLIQDTAGLGRSGEVLVSKRSGDDVVYLNPLRHDAGAALKRRVPFGGSSAVPAQKALRGETGVGRSVDYRGKDVIAAWQYIPSLEWGLVAKIDSREAFEAITELRRLVFVILAVALALAGVTTIFVTRSISRPILALSKGAEIIGGGDLNYKVGTAMKDEIGQLSRAFDKMTHDLKATMASRDDLNREIAERKSAEQDLVRSNTDLEQFAYVASHDLQEPLRAVAGFMGLLKRQHRPNLDAEGQEYIDLAIEGAERMQTLISDLLAFSRVGTKGGTFEPMQLRDAVESAVRYLQASIAESDARISYGDLPSIHADRAQMTQLLQNLIGNALKFRGERQPDIRIGAERKDGNVVVRVVDNGIGIEPQYFQRIFLIFQRLHTRTEYQGTGIGLAICKKIVERHGGKLWVESEPGNGSEFYFTIPDKGANV